MIDYSELILLLRQTRASMLGTPDEEVYVNCQEAAYVIEAQAKRIAELEAALKPFAYYAKHIHDDVSDMASASGTVGDLRRAREALGDK
jgi:hypothetical protein